jgi:serine/threonine protein kinase
MNQNQEKENLHTIGNYILNPIIIAKGSFGTIYKGEHNKKREPVAIKTENHENNSLRHETRILQYLYEHGVRKIPQIYWYGKSMIDTVLCQVLILPFYSCNLETYVKNKPLSKGQLTQLIIKCLNIVQQIHSKFVVHRDIKPANFMIKGGDIFLIDFGLATFYLDENGQHICDDNESDMIGTIKYASLNIHEGHRFSRRDDLISLVYMYDYMANNGNIRWSPAAISDEVPTESMQTMQNAWMQSKKQYLLALNGNSNSNLYKLYETVYTFEYKEKPDYFKIKMLFDTSEE